jgi:hypothetical protein
MVFVLTRFPHSTQTFIRLGSSNCPLIGSSLVSVNCLKHDNICIYLHKLLDTNRQTETKTER